MQIKELGHAVLYVRSLEASRHFYRDILGFNEISADPRGFAAFSSGRTHHELLLIEVGATAAPLPSGRRTGLYHLGFKVGTSDHGVTHSLYVLDPDDNELELYIDVQPEVWRDDPSAVMAPIRPLSL